MVVSGRPLGDTPVRLDPAEWEGTWTAADGGPVVVRVDDAAGGQLRLAWIEGEKEMVLKTAMVSVLRSGPWFFANMREDVKDASPSVYLFALVKRQKGTMLIWPPRPESFARLIREGVLPGTVTKEKVLLGELKPEQMKIIASEDRGVLFDWENPIVLMKMGDR